MILPGSTLGMLGGGQLGRMFTVAARTMGYRVFVLDPDPESPAGKIADKHLQADYHDPIALQVLQESCEAITTEFENVPADILEKLAESSIVRPSAKAVANTQDRIAEKTFLLRSGIPTNKFAPIFSTDDLGDAVEYVGFPSILKRSRFGYDGKGQWRVKSLDEARAAFKEGGDAPCVLEEFLPFQTEVSVVLARADNGVIAAYPTGENFHEHGILDITLVPARVSEDIHKNAQSIAKKTAEALEYVGVMAVEMFVMADGKILVNEIAPRPHNSGHYTLDACTTDQFEQQVRVLCGLPPGETKLLSPVVMVNMLGDLWGGDEPNWRELLKYPNVKLHLYGKSSARKGRKMGHFNILAENLETAFQLGKTIKKAIAHE